MFCLMCNMQELNLYNNKIGDAGLLPKRVARPQQKE